MFVRQQRADGKELMAAGVTAERGKTEEAASERENARDVFRCDALELGVAAIAAPSVEGKPKRDGTGVEALFAVLTAPRIDIDETNEIVDE